MTTNIIRGPLLKYTNDMCELYGIPLVSNVASGPIWDDQSHDWGEVLADMPITPEGKLLLVPKAIVRRTGAYNLSEYYRHYLLVQMQKDELAANTALVHVLKNKRRVVYKSHLQEKYGSKKPDIVRETIKRPSVLEDYKSAKSTQPFIALSHEIIATTEGTSSPDWDALYNEVKITPAGHADSTKYEKSIEALLSALFYPDLVNPVAQYPIHNGRKRIDIVYTNMAVAGFYSWLSKHYISPSIFIECKNYTGEVQNPELDQLSGRFSLSRGKVGVLICRKFDDKALFLQRCRDTASDSRGYILALDDGDLKELVDYRKGMIAFQAWPLLIGRFNQLVM